MIAKITRGSDGAGLVRYLIGEGRAEEHTDQRVIAAADMVVVPMGTALSPDEVGDLGRQLDAHAGAVRDRGHRRPHLAPGPVEPGGRPAALRRPNGRAWSATPWAASGSPRRQARRRAGG